MPFSTTTGVSAFYNDLTSAVLSAEPMGNVFSTPIDSSAINSLVYIKSFLYPNNTFLNPSFAILIGYEDDSNRLGQQVDFSINKINISTNFMMNEIVASLTGSRAIVPDLHNEMKYIDTVDLSGYIQYPISAAEPTCSTARTGILEKRYLQDDYGNPSTINPIATIAGDNNYEVIINNILDTVSDLNVNYGAVNNTSGFFNI